MKIQKLRASHILISHEGATAQSSNRPAPAAEQEAGFIIQDIIEGLLTFEQAAKEHSACRISAKNGGDLGWFDYPGDGSVEYGTENRYINVACSMEMALLRVILCASAVVHSCHYRARYFAEANH